MDEFEFDPVKSAANRDKHGIDFLAAQAMWGVGGIERDLAHPVETRIMRIGIVQDKVWSAVFTPRRGKIRLISVRRARKDEVEEYERSEKDQ